MNQISKCLDQQKIKAICDIVAHKSQGLTKSQLTTLLGQCRICVVDDGSSHSQLGYTIGLNKREWLYNCLVTEINKSHSFCKIISFLQAALNPALYTSNDSRQIYVNVASMDYRDGAELYHFNQDQDEMLVELMRPDYYPLFAELLGDTVGDGGEYGFGLNINPDLPPNELGAQIVQAAKRYIGRSYSSMDCSGLVRAAYRDCVLSSINGLTSTGMAQKCRDMGVLFTDSSQLQAGDLIFFARKDASRGEGYCTDTRRCGTGRCKRWLQIHHVAIYINDEFLIDSTGGNNSVQIRKHWGKNGSEWEWVCFGRPTN